MAKELNKPVWRKLNKRSVIAVGVDDVSTADLVDISLFSRNNKGFKFIFSIIDVFSKYGWLVSLKNKKSFTVEDAFHAVFKSSRIPTKQ